MAVARGCVLALIGIYVGIADPYPGSVFHFAILAIFLVLGLARLRWARRLPKVRFADYVFTTLDLLLLGFALVAPHPLANAPLSPQLALASGGFAFFYLPLALSVLTGSAGHVLWTGLGSALLWGAITALMAAYPATVTMFDYADWTAMPLHARLDAMRQPGFADVTGAIRDAALICLVAVLLAIVVERMRRRVSNRTGAELQRANLARYFSPHLAEEIAGSDGLFRTGVEQQAAVMFVDIRGFTAFAEQLSPHLTLEILRSFHLRMSQQVFAHDGALDKFIGDGLMATFGVPRKGPRDAANAIACALAIRQAIEEWNAFREKSEYPPVRIGIGLHYGPVVMGDIGSGERMEFAVIGDTVNVASRLEQLSRQLNTDIVLSDDLVAAAHAETEPDDPLFDGFRESPEQTLRGRLTGKIVWIYDAALAREDMARRFAAIDLAPGGT